VLLSSTLTASTVAPGPIVREFAPGLLCGRRVGSGRIRQHGGQDGANDNRVAVNLLPSTTNSANDFLDTLTGTVSGHLYYDANGNGVQNAGEPNLSNVTVSVSNSVGGVTNVTTDSSGNWSAIVPAGITRAKVDTADPDLAAQVPPVGAVRRHGPDDRHSGGWFEHVYGQ